MSSPSRPRVLSIAGTDPSGGAGASADLKSFTAMGAYGMSVITCLVVQNTTGVKSVFDIPIDVINQQLYAVSDDVKIDAVKIGMLGNVEIIHTVKNWLEEVAPEYVVLDPVMVASSGDRLLEQAAENALIDLLPQASLITPNLSELAVLTASATARSYNDMLTQASNLAQEINVYIYAKGGHFEGKDNTAPDALVDPNGEVVLELSSKWVTTQNTHGTGCSLSSAIAALRPRVDSWQSAVREAKDWLTGAIENADALQVSGSASGIQANGPIDHTWKI